MTTQSPHTTGSKARTTRRALPALAIAVAVAATWGPSPARAAVAPNGVARAAGPAGSAPPTFVAVTGRDVSPPRLAEYQSATGRRLRFLTPRRPGGGPSNPVLDAAGSTVLYAAGGGTCASDIFSVRTDGSAPPRLLVPGSTGPAVSPALAPSDKRIAYVQEHCDATPAALVVRSVPAPGPEVVPYQGSPGELILDPRWSRHGRLSFLTQGGPRPGLHTVPAAPGAPVVTSQAPAGCFWSSADWFARGGRDLLLASMQCGSSGRWQVLDAQLATVRLLPSPEGQLGAQSVSVDATGSWAIYQENGASMPGAVWRWRFASQAPQLLTRGPFSPTWC